MSSTAGASDLNSSNYDLLFNKPSYQSEWDEKSPDRSSIFSVPPDEASNLVSSKEQLERSSEAGSLIASASANFQPTLVRFEPRVSFEPSYDISAYTEDPLEGSRTGRISEDEGSENQTELEEESLSGTYTTMQKLEDEGKCMQEDNNPVDYLDKEVFPVLLPCLEKMLFAAKENNVLKVQKSRFNGLDFLAELLWNCNPLHPERKDSHVPIFDIPFVQKHLEVNPRPTIPQSWLWSRDQAAIVIQSAVRGFLVRRQPHVQELRQFWKTLAEENQLK